MAIDLKAGLGPSGREVVDAIVWPPDLRSEEEREEGKRQVEELFKKFDKRIAEQAREIEAFKDLVKAGPYGVYIGAEQPRH